MNRIPPAGVPWMASLPEGDAAAAAGARLEPVEVAAAAGRVWLRGRCLTDSQISALRGASGLEWAEPMPGGRWRRPGDRLPSGSLPADLHETDWRPLAAALVPDMPDADVAAAPSPALHLRIVPGGPERQACLLLTTIEQLCAWAETAAEVRLKPLRFAVSQNGAAIVHGTPLPPLSAPAWWEAGGIAVPCGWQPEPALSPVLIRRILRLPDSWQGLCLLPPPGEAECIPSDCFASLTRAGARLSAALVRGV